MTVKADRGERVTQSLDERAYAILDELARTANFLRSASMFMHAGTAVNGERSIVWPLAPKSDAERY